MILQNIPLLRIQVPIILQQLEGFDSNDKLIQNFEAIDDNSDKKINYSEIKIEEELFDTKGADPFGKGKKYNQAMK